jgi:glycosyltransferase involved in cell wall biosynthesis
MQETNHAFFVLDEYASGATLPSGPARLKGWAVAKAGSFITDLRVRIKDRIYPSFYGIPRPDLAHYFKARESFLLGGFEIDLLLTEGENRLEFECCEIRGHWLPLASFRFVGTAGHALASVPSGEVGAPVFTRALRLLWQQLVTRSSIEHAAQAIAGLIPLPHVTRYPSLPFHGHLHHPPPIQRAQFGRINVEGWLFHETARIRRVAATVDLQAWQVLEYGEPLPYVAGLFPQFSNAASCRIHGLIDVPAQLPQPLSLRIYAELADGTWHLCHVERNHLYGDEQHKAPYPPFNPFTFVRSVRTLRRACLQRGLTVPIDRWFFRGLREVWHEYRARSVSRSMASSSTATVSADLTRKLPDSVALISHNLNLEGAPLFLLEYACYLASRGVKLVIFSAAEGPLRSSFEKIGARVEIIDITSLLKSRTKRSLRAELRKLTTQLNFATADLVVANTLSAFWGVLLAHRAGKKSLFYIHESTTPDSFYYGHMAPATLPVVKEAFSTASHISFLTDSTRRYYRANLPRQNHSINAGWIDLGSLDRFREKNTREQLRAQLSLSPSIRLVINVGTVCDRKGQHIFVRAVDLLWRRRPDLASQCEFLMVGGRHTSYDQAIAQLVAYVNRPNLRVVAETPEPQRYYGAADLFVCSSYEESFPRVLLEAMAFQLPIVSTAVHGIPEMARADQEAVLVEPGDPSALADGMARVLSSDELARLLAANARVRVAAEYDAVHLLPRHAALAASAVGLTE